MCQQWSRVAVAPGTDVVCRAGQVVLLVRSNAPAEQDMLRTLVSIVQEGTEGRDVVRSIAAAALGAPAADVPSFGMVALTHNGPTVLLQGAASATWDQEDDAGVLHGTEASTFAERLLPAAVTTIELSFHDSGQADDLSDLVSGIVRGSGVRMHLGPDDDHAEPVGVQEDAPATSAIDAALRPVGNDQNLDPPPQFEVFGLLTMDPEPTVETPTTLDGGAEPTPAEPEATPVSRSVMVEGIRCSRGHFNNPRALYCGLCGIAMVQQTHRPVRDVRPPLGVLVTDDGLVFSLNGDFVIGREPEASAEVQQGVATPLMLDDPALSMSRVHLHVRLVGWDVYLEDAGSANGTYVTVEGDEQQLTARQPTKAAPGTLIAIGGRTVSFESHHRS